MLVRLNNGQKNSFHGDTSETFFGLLFRKYILTGKVRKISKNSHLERKISKTHELSILFRIWAKFGDIWQSQSINKS
jgi:hypothetical protein